MANPANPLDIYASYVYHFELHAADSWDKLKHLVSKDNNNATDRFTPNGTLLINTRKDAHQHIDDVRFLTMSEATSKTEILTPVGTLSLTISEPGGFSFVEKLALLRSSFNVSNNTGLVFLLKIFFVCRTPANDIETLTVKLIPMVLDPNSSAAFSETGGKYNMTFSMNAMLGATDGLASGAAMSYSFVQRTVSFYSGTVEGALKTLEKHLNDGYEEIYKKLGTSDVGKRLVYKITFDPEIRGEIKSLNKDSLSPNEPSKFVFSPNLQIASYIHTILKKCPELQQKIGASKGALQLEGHPGLFVPIIQPRVNYHDDRIEINYHVAINRGGIEKSFIFDYYFADAGKNVDILSYDVKFHNIGAWVPEKTTIGYDWALNQSSTMQLMKPSIWKNQIVTPDTTRAQNQIDAERSAPDVALKNDPRLQPSSTTGDQMGHNNMPFDSTPSVRLGSSTILDFMTAIAPEQMFEIRGHLDLLSCAAYYPDETEPGGWHYGSMFHGGNVWIKVNIWMPDSRYPGGKRQFFYTNYYWLQSIEHIFSGGQFKQMLKVVMHPAAEANLVKGS